MEYMAMAAMKPCMDRNHKKAPVGRLVLFCCVRYLMPWAFEEESALGGIPEG